VLFIGCGNGVELLLGAHFGAKECVGIEFLDYGTSWSRVREYARTRYPQTSLAFHTVGSLDPSALPEAVSSSGFDLVFTSAVLEHVADLPTFLENVSRLLLPAGYLFSVWGPMWWSYGGDHIAPELGLDQGFVHLELSDEEYDDWYRRHPRNRGAVEAGIPTWKDHNLYSFLRYDEYMTFLEQYFTVEWQTRIWSAEGIEFGRIDPKRVDRIVSQHSIRGFDPYLKSAGVLASRRL
jgi:SAM-dependent methyltransferase